MSTYEPNTILRILEGEVRIATARVLPDGCLLEVKPRSFKMYKHADDWLNDQSSYSDLTLQVTTPEDREEERVLQLGRKKEAEAARLASESPDIQKVRSLYDALHLKDSLTKQHERIRKVPGLWVELGNEITPVWFSRKTGVMMTGFRKNRILSSFDWEGTAYTGTFYTKGTGGVSLRRL